MKKKALKIAALAAAAVLIAGVGAFANSLVGNPVSRALAAGTAKKHLAKNYAGTDFFVQDISFSFKDGNYYAHIKSPSSIDRYFSLCISMGGRLVRDSYSDVMSGSNTARRLNGAYRELAGTVLESPVFPYPGEIAFGDLAFIPREYAGAEDVPSYALIEEDLETDKLYDIPGLGERAGHLVIYVDDETVSAGRAAEIMLEISRLMEEGGVPFYAMDFVLRRPRGEDDRRPEGRVEVRQFLRADIYEEGMEERVRAANDAQLAYYAAQDAEKALQAGK